MKGDLIYHLIIMILQNPINIIFALLHSHLAPSFLKVEAKVVVAVLVAAFIVILILIDVCCFCVNDCGLLMCLCVQCCGRHTGTHEVDVELAADYS